MKEQENFKPFVPAEKTLPEFTATSIILGIIIAVLFGGANAYLGLRVGMTVSASIPAAVISMGIIRVILKRDSVLENNMVQTIGSAGESVAAGAIFTLPALFLWANEWKTAFPSLLEIAIIAAIGGCLGVLFMVPLRKALIVKEHGTLPYPEGQACAEVLLAGEEGGAKAGLVFKGLGIAALYKFIADGLKLFPSEVHYEIPAYPGAGAGADVLPALLGVGYICGTKISSYLFAGGVLGWFVLMPMIVLFGSNIVLFPSTSQTIGQIYAELGSMGIWSNYIKYIGAGAVAAGGFISLIKSLPLIVTTFKDAIKDFGKTSSDNDTLRTDRDLPMSFILAGIVIFALILWLIPLVPINLFSAFMIVVFGFFFATVSSRMVGLIGSSNNPVSGMTIATVLIASILLKLTGQTGREGMIAAIAIGAVICIIAAIAGDTSQDLKTGYIVGATPKRQQIGELIGVVASAVAIGAILYLLNAAWGYGSTQLPAAQATLMKMIVEGVMGGNLPWNLIFVGVFIGIVVEILGIPVLPFAVGLYLPIHLSVPMMIGGAIRWIIEKKKDMDEAKKKAVVEDGVLFSSGLIAGEGLIGILLAVFAIIPMKGGSSNLGEILGNFGSQTFLNSNLGGIVFFLILIAIFFKLTLFKKAKSNEE
ncbi:OPT family oligopeptide transporter [Anaerofustis stercorihominis]|uniref:Oligopeptide transporter, OPT family n=2 Tax=Anaerofustis stercorihominis TaxID=214853 RepID=B1C8T9_9FIRM|nr:oligopeptide transporter, OPT family [Anaerofustis stercorihominis]EDS71999.1 oligopeptide transporter, OPT family [Anaerofustis stercorihominis DSM 17244]MCQ4795950.1 oligopeptide transporter, OPT family [Anaerofustis stercorihominis]RGD74957.1 oligopeptide transporter, OPT family [Anaerofustis stercorihominis]